MQTTQILDLLLFFPHVVHDNKQQIYTFYWIIIDESNGQNSFNENATDYYISLAANQPLVYSVICLLRSLCAFNGVQTFLEALSDFWESVVQQGHR